MFAPYRKDSSLAIPYFLTPKTYFVGEETYEQSCFIPKDWKGQRVTLSLERVHIVSHVWVNGVEANSLYSSIEVGKGCRSLAAPHQYDLTELIKPGQDNQLRIVVDNRLINVPVGSNSYSVSDNDQGNWNGFVGEAKLIAQPAISIIESSLQVYPQVETSSAEIVMRISRSQSSTSGNLTNNKPIPLLLNLETEAGKVAYPIQLERDSQEIRVTLQGLHRLWNEYTPNLYHLNIKLMNKKKRLLDEQQVTFGMRQVTCDDHFVRINGDCVYLRGTVDGAQFPLTGYPPTDLDFWTHYCSTVKEWGCNMVRFHSWCPPEAAFRAADSLGLYLQVECSSWPNHDVFLDLDNETAHYIEQEADQILQTYGNHPSFLLLAAGNEPKGKNWLGFAEQWVTKQAIRDKRHLYVAFSVGGSWPWCKNNQIQVRAGLRGLDWHRRKPESMSDFNASVDTFKVPFIGHEVGQWCTYPPVRDIDKYTGLMRPGLLTIAKDGLSHNGMLAQADSFVMASGRLQVVCYKHEMERLRRTRFYGGYNLQALADYMGQGTAPEGVLNVFYEPKGYIDAQEWRQWAGDVVPLMRTKQFTYEETDTVHFTLELSNQGRGVLQQVNCSYRLLDAAGTVLMQKDYPKRDFAWGGGQLFANEKIALSDLRTKYPACLTLEVNVGSYKNQWHIWVYESAPILPVRSVYVTRVPDEKAKQILSQGGKVLMIGFDQVNYGRSIDQRLLPQFWNHLWMPKYTGQTLGLLIRNEHPIFKYFPTEFHSDVQWWELINRAYPMVLNRMPKAVEPLVQPIDHSYRNLKLGMLFEVKVGKGKLVMTNLDLLSKPGQRMVSRQLFSSILRYMQTDDFDPKVAVTFDDIMNLYTHFY